PPIIQVHSDPPLSDPSENLDLPIGLHKGIRTCKFTYSIANFVSSNRLSSMSRSIIVSLDFISVPKTVNKAFNRPGWSNAMLEKIHALEDNRTGNLVDLPKGKKPMGCLWVFTIRVNIDGYVARLKAR
ncbi:hypothetical protein A4A49_65273, partial [Nicotiana attenuata]